MSDGLMIGLATVFASIFSVAISQALAFYLNKRKAPAEIRKLDSDSKLTNGELTVKYQEIAVRQADENIELGQILKSKEAENKNLAKAYEELRVQLQIMEERHNEEIQEIKDTFEKERKENEKWRNWAKRLVMQLQSFDLQPVPFDLEEAKRNGTSLGDIGAYPKK